MTVDVGFANQVPPFPMIALPALGKSVLIAKLLPVQEVNHRDDLEVRPVDTKHVCSECVVCCKEPRTCKNL